MYKKYIAGAVAAATLLPMVALADAAATQAQIQALLSQIQTLQAQLKVIIATSTPQWHATVTSSFTPNWGGNLQSAPLGLIGKALCISLTRNLGVGSRGEDVRKLQELLGSDPENGFRGNATGFFGLITARAMMKFQQRNAIASSTDGSVGPLTRAFFTRSCGHGLGGNAGPNDQGGGQGDIHGGAIRGTITSSSASSITVLGVNDVSRSATINASTTIKVFIGGGAPTDGTIGDLVVGKKVSVEGPADAAGVITAKHINVGELPPPTPEAQGQDRQPAWKSDLNPYFLSPNR